MEYLKSKIRWTVLLCVLMLNGFWGSTACFAQEGGEMSAKEQRIGEQLNSYISEVQRLLRKVSHAMGEEVKTLGTEAERIDVKWNLYCQSSQEPIANSDTLLQTVADYQLLQRALTDSIRSKEAYASAVQQLKTAENYFLSQRPRYEKMVGQAEEYALTKSLAKKLEKLKLEEQLLFAEVQRQYDLVMGTFEQCPDLLGKKATFEQQFLELKDFSIKIQEAKYQPLFQRIKDYVYGLAAVAMILMFINMAHAKIKAWKEKKAQLKKMREMFPQEDEEYPTL